MCPPLICHWLINIIKPGSLGFNYRIALVRSGVLRFGTLFYLESKMETIRKKLDVLRHTLNEAEDRATNAENELAKSTERNAKVGITLSLCVGSFLQLSKICLKKSSTFFFSRKLSIMSSNWNGVTPHATGLDEQNNFAKFLKLMSLHDNTVVLCRPKRKSRRWLLSFKKWKMTWMRANRAWLMWLCN